MIKSFEFRQEGQASTGESGVVEQWLHLLEENFKNDSGLVSGCVLQS